MIRRPPPRVLSASRPPRHPTQRPPHMVREQALSSRPPCPTAREPRPPRPRRPAPARPRGGGAAAARAAEGLPRRLARAWGRPTPCWRPPAPSGRTASTSWSAWWRPTAGPETARLLEGLEILPRRAHRVPRHAAGGVRPRRRAGAAPRAAPGGRAGAHQRAGLPPRQALAGRRGAARRRHQRLHHAQHPAHREPERRRRPDHRRARCARPCRTRCSSGPTRSSWSTSPRTSCSSGCARGRSTSPSRPSRAIDRFFRKGNLIALRELALRRTAERVDAQMRGYMAEQGIRETWAAAERLLVCVGPSADRRSGWCGPPAAWRPGCTPTGSRCTWRRPRDQRLSPAEREDILRALELAEQLGGRTVTLSGQSVADEILAYARDHNVTRIVVGKAAGAGAGASGCGARCWTRWSAAAGRSRSSRSPARRKGEQPRPALVPRRVTCAGVRRRRRASSLVPTAAWDASAAASAARSPPSTRRCCTSWPSCVAAARYPPGARRGRGPRRHRARSTSSSCIRSTPSRCSDVRYVLTFGVMLRGGTGAWAT